MVREIAFFGVQEGRSENSVEAYNWVAHVPNGASGSHGATLYRGIEDPNSSTSSVEWDFVDAHTVLTREPAFKGFGDALGPCLAGRPRVRNIEAVR